MHFIRLINLSFFQLGWLACVLGGSVLGAVAVAVILAGHLRWLAYPGEWRWLLGFALLGLGVETAITLAGGYGATVRGPLAPAWLWLLWPLFATLLNHGLVWLWHHPRLAMLGGALGAASAYALGARLAGVELAGWVVPLQAVLWGLLCRVSSHRFGVQQRGAGH